MTIHLLKKIIIITHNFLPESVGGASRIYEMAKMLQRLYDVSIICPPPTYPFKKYEKAKYLSRKEILDGLRVFRLWTYQPSRQSPTFFQRFFYYIAFPFLATLFVIPRLHNTEFVIVTDPPSSLLFTTLIVRLFRKKLILDVRDLWVEAALSLGFVNKKSVLANIVKKFEEHCWRKSDLVITNSLVIADEIVRVLGQVFSPKVKYFPFNVDLNIFKRSDIKRENQIVYVGNFGMAQDLGTFVKAMSVVLSEMPDIKIKLYGGGDYELEIKKLVKELNMEKSFEFNDPVSRKDIPAILSKSLIGIVPLASNEVLRYAIPTKTFEYLACSLPVLAYGNSKELERIIKESEGGVFIRENDYKAISDAILRMLQDKNALERYSNNGRKFVEQKVDYSFFLQVT